MLSTFFQIITQVRKTVMRNSDVIVSSPLSENQWGLTSGKSTTSALISLTHDCLEALDRGFEVCSIFFDLS